MKSLIKLGVAGALALSGSIAAHASMNVPVSSGTAGDVFLFADVFSGSTLVGAYAGDTGISVDTLSPGSTLPTSASPFKDGGLTNFLALATQGTTVEWALVGGSGFAASTGGNPLLASSGPASTFTGLVGATMATMGSALVSTMTSVGGAAAPGNSLLVTTASTLAGGNKASLGGTGFNPGAQSADVYNWSQFTSSITTVGLGSSSQLFGLSAADTFGSIGVLTDIATATLGTNGLVFSSNVVSAVPLPPAVWLLGAGLLALAGVARRKPASGLSNLSAV